MSIYTVKILVKREIEYTYHIEADSAMSAYDYDNGTISNFPEITKSKETITTAIKSIELK